MQTVDWYLDEIGRDEIGGSNFTHRNLKIIYPILKGVGLVKNGELSWDALTALEAAEKQEQDPAEDIQHIQIVAAIDSNGELAICDADGGCNVEDALTEVRAAQGADSRCFIIEADLPVPAVKTVQATVKRVKEGEPCTTKKR